MSKILLCQLAAWTLSLLVAFLAIFKWGTDNDWQLSSVYQFFPLLGLLAFSIMWSHYIAAALRQFLSLDRGVLSYYFQTTSLAVLVLLLLHPGLLAYQRLADGFGLPPGSLYSYVGTGLAWLIVLGLISLICFLVFELHRWHQDRGWWPYVAAASDLAMLAAFYHGLRLGGQLNEPGWFLTIWWFYGLSLIVILARKYLLLLKARLGGPANDPK